MNLTSRFLSNTIVLKIIMYFEYTREIYYRSKHYEQLLDQSMQDYVDSINYISPPGRGGDMYGL